MTEGEAISSAVADGAAGKKVTVLLPTMTHFDAVLEAMVVECGTRRLAPRFERVAGGLARFQFGTAPARVLVVNYSIPGMFSGIDFDGSAVVFWPERLPPVVASLLLAEADTVRYVR